MGKLLSVAATAVTVTAILEVHSVFPFLIILTCITNTLQGPHAPFLSCPLCPSHILHVFMCNNLLPVFETVGSIVAMMCAKTCGPEGKPQSLPLFPPLSQTQTI